MPDFDKMAADVVAAAQAFVTRSLQTIIQRLDAIEQWPAAKDGAAGKDGRDGIDGKDGATGEAGHCGEQGGEGPAGKDGAAGRDGIDGKDGATGEAGHCGEQGGEGPAGKDGAAGRDGRDGLPGLQGEKGIDGKDGRDGFGLEDFDVTLDGRVLSLKFMRGEIMIERTLTLPLVMDAGIYRSGNAYAKGDGATHNGSWWIAQEDTGDTPGTSGAWRLAAKRGRDGKDAIVGEKGPQIVRLR